jgi:mono/diheme cytochrome c family protein
MRFAIALLILSAACTFTLTGVVTATATQDKARTTWDGVYSDGQSKRGADTYAKTCSSCHAEDLSGADGPSLTGPDFNKDFDGQSVDDLFERVRTTMPADGPGSLTREQYADIVAFLLSKDSFPAGATDLPADNDALKQIKFTAQKP